MGVPQNHPLEWYFPIIINHPFWVSPLMEPPDFPYGGKLPWCHFFSSPPVNRHGSTEDFNRAKRNIIIWSFGGFRSHGGTPVIIHSNRWIFHETKHPFSHVFSHLWKATFVCVGFASSQTSWSKFQKKKQRHTGCKFGSGIFRFYAGSRTSSIFWISVELLPAIMRILLPIQWEVCERLHPPPGEASGCVRTISWALFVQWRRDVRSF